MTTTNNMNDPDGGDRTREITDFELMTLKRRHLRTMTLVAASRYDKGDITFEQFVIAVFELLDHER